MTKINLPAITIPPTFSLLMEKLPNAKFYLIGGYPRDIILGNVQSKDYDIEVFKTSPSELINAANSIGINLIQTTSGERKFPVWKGVFDNEEVDISFPRREALTGRNSHTNFDCEIDPNMSIEEAASRRDFTIGAIYVDLKTGEWIDPTGGISDCRNKILRIVNPKRFGEDPLRVIRGAQFAARFELTIDEDTKTIMKNTPVGDVCEPNKKSRIREEVYKAFTRSKKPSTFFKVLDEVWSDKLTNFKHIFDLKNIEQNPEYHPEGNVFNHVMNSIDNIVCDGYSKDDKFLLRTAALYHDIGKLWNTKPNKRNLPSHIGHDSEESSKQGLELLSLWCDDKKVKDVVDIIIRYHERTKQATSISNKMKYIKRFKPFGDLYFNENLHEENVNTFKNLKVLDILKRVISVDKNANGHSSLLETTFDVLLYKWNDTLLKYNEHGGSKRLQKYLRDINDDLIKGKYFKLFIRKTFETIIRYDDPNVVILYTTILNTSYKQTINIIMNEKSEK